MFTIISKDNCVWCDKAKDLIRENEQEFVETDVRVKGILPLMKKAGLKTVPQIWVDTPSGNEYIGGYEDLVTWITESES